MTKLRVAIVDDSPIAREVLREILEEEGDISVVGEAADGEGALSMVRSTSPALVTLDVEMPKVDGLATVERIMASHPVPILIVTGRPAERREATLFEAVKRGALDLVEKPTLGRSAEGARLRALARSLAKVPVMRHIAGKRQLAERPSQAPKPISRSSLRVLGIGASAGGPAAVSAVLRALPAQLPIAVALVQHILPGFAAPFARFLQAQTELRVCVVDGPMHWEAGIVFVAPDDRHLIAAADETFRPSDEPAVGGHRPSVDVLLRSLARSYGPSAMGVVLSGMGEDGALGLGEMAKRGAMTVAQSEASSVVYGMPRVAFERGAAKHAMTPEEIAETVLMLAPSRGLP